ncbi:hypothetical protein Ancab_011463 [Ancistrocladus abbreviatus]
MRNTFQKNLSDQTYPTNGICVFSSTNSGWEKCQEMLMYCRKPKKKSMEAIMKMSPKHGVASSKVLSLKANRMASKMDINECSKDGVCSREFVHNSQFMNWNHILCDYGATGISMFVMRLLRPGIPLPSPEPRPTTAFVTVSHSEFLNKINGNQVQKVEVDVFHIMFRLNNDGLVMVMETVKWWGVVVAVAV